MPFLSDVAAELSADHTLAIAFGLGATWLLARAFAPEDRRRVTGTAVLVGVHAALVPVAVLLREQDAGAARLTLLASLLAAEVAAVSMLTLLAFDVALPRARVRVPSIVRDLSAAAGAVAGAIATAHRIGYDLTGIVATSAVMTAVIGFSLQDTLGNVMGGIALQLDDSVKVGDWVTVAGVTGRVSEIRWRHTAIETRSWETLIVPNSVLMKGQVTVLGRRRGQPLQLRRYIWFNVDFRSPPGAVIRAVDEALTAAPVESVAAEPRPHCVLMELDRSYGRYAARYWLTDIDDDDRTDTLVRSRIFFALRRAGIPFSIPAEANFVETDSPRRRRDKAARDLERRLQALSHVSILGTLSEEDRVELARSLHAAPFARGEALTRQGAEAHWLYIVETGEVAVRVAIDGAGEREVARMRDGSFFGEMSLMTGAPRAATVTALTDVRCWRLEKEAFRRVIERRPRLAEEIAKVLAERKTGLDAVREGLSDEAARARLAGHERDLLDSIKTFFGLSGAA